MGYSTVAPVSPKELEQERKREREREREKEKIKNKKGYKQDEQNRKTSR